MTDAVVPDHIEVVGLRWPEVRPGDDLAALFLAVWLVADGDIVVLTSKVVSKAEDRSWPGDRAAAIDAETVRVVARRGPTTIAETRQGFVMAAAGVDASNAPEHMVLRLPADPDASARRFREQVWTRTGRNVGVVVTDTLGRAWRLGQTDAAIGCAGLPPLVDLAGRLDMNGRQLEVTAPAVADEIAAAGDLVKGKVEGRPVAVVRGLAGLVNPPDDQGPGVHALLRPAAEDLFGLGAKEAALAVVERNDEAAAHLPGFDPACQDPFGGLAELTADGAEARVTVEPAGRARAWVVAIEVQPEPVPATWVTVGRMLERAEGLAFAHRLQQSPLADTTDSVDEPERRTVSRVRWVPR